MDYSKISVDERNVADTQKQAYKELREISRSDSSKFDSKLSWEIIKGKEYLIQTKGSKRKVLGTKAPHMIDFYEKYTTRQKALIQRIVGLRKKIDECRVQINRTTIGRVPTDAAMVLRKLEKEALLGENFIISGLQCIYAYESHANVRFKQNLKDKDIYNISKAAEKSLVLLGTVGDEKKLFQAVLEVDPSYSIKGNKGRYRLTNKNNFCIDLVCSENKKSNWMLAVPRIESIAFCDSGLPVPFVCLAPHVFALYKYWQSQNYQDKLQATKAEIDSKQAFAITDMVKQELGKCITEEDYSAVPDCITSYKDQLATETEEKFGRTYEI